MRQLAAAVSSPGRPCSVAFLEQDHPDVPGALATIAGSVRALALLLTPGYHAQVDLPALLAGRPDVDYLGLLGVQDWLPPTLEDLVAAAGGSPARSVVLVAAGSRHPDALDELAAVSQAWGECRTGAVALAVASGPGPDLAEVAARFADPIVVPLVIAPGVSSDRIAQEAGALGLRVTGVLADSAGLPRAISRRLHDGPRVHLPGGTDAVDMSG